MIEAFAKVAPRFPDARVLVVGHPATTGGTPRAVLEQQARATGFGERIRFEGYRKDFGRILSSLDIFIHPAIGDTISLAPLEASAAGLPVVAYAEGGALEGVIHGRTGLLAPPRDVDTLAECLATLLADPDAARRMGAAGRDFVRSTFRPEAWGRAFADVLHHTHNRPISFAMPPKWHENFSLSW